jgi:hypothetical protein
LALFCAAPDAAFAQRDVVRAPSVPGVATTTDSLAEQLRAGLPSGAQRMDEGRFTVVAYASDAKLARAMLSAALQNDSFPGIRRPRAKVLIAIAPDEARFRAWAGPSAPEWGAAVAFPSLQRVIMQGARAGSDAGDPTAVLRHELAHLALYEAMGDLPTRWFDEGYASVAAGEWGREEALAASVGLAIRGVPTLEQLELLFYRGASDAQMAYALAHRAVADLQARDPANGLRIFLDSWKETGSFEQGVRRAYGMTSADFEKEWQRVTRRRYGTLALLANLSLAFGVFALVLGPLVYQRRKRDRARLEAMRVADAAQEAALRQSMLEAMLAADLPPDETLSNSGETLHSDEVR